MRPNNNAKEPRWAPQVAFTEKPVSGWGGLVAFTRYLECLHLRELLCRALPDGRTSNNQICAVDQVLAFFAAVLTGSQRFSHVERIRNDEVIQSVFAIDRMPSAATLTRYFNGFTRPQVEAMVGILSRFHFPLVSLPAGGDVVDFDSSVITRYGRQEGSMIGYNPGRRGRRSHHPILAMLAGAKMVLNAWMRAGNSNTANGICGFFLESVARLPPGTCIAAVRADAGFCLEDFFLLLESRKTPYAVVLKQDARVRRLILDTRNWTQVDDHHSVAELTLQMTRKSPPRRVVVVREREREGKDSVGRTLFEVPGYTFRTFITNLALPAAEVWRFYDHRADCENRIKELKDDFGAVGFCMRNFDGTDAAFRLICFLFNLVAHFKAKVTGDTKPQLNSLRSKLFVVGAILGAAGHNAVLRLGLRGRRRVRFERVLSALDSYASTATQLDLFRPIQGLASPPTWAPRPPKRPGPRPIAAPN